MPASRRDIVATLLERHIAAQPSSAGMLVTRLSRNERFLMLGLSILFADRLDLAVATRAIRELRRRGLDSPDALAAASLRELTAALAAAGYGSPHPAAEKLRELGRSIEREYGGDLEQLRKRADREPEVERKLLKDFDGVGNVAVDIFFQHAQGAWRELFPFLAPRARRAAEELGLPGEPRALAKLAGLQLPLLGASLITVYSAKDYEDVLSKARHSSKPRIIHGELPQIKAKRQFEEESATEDVSQQRATTGNLAKPPVTKPTTSGGPRTSGRSAGSKPPGSAKPPAERPPRGVPPQGHALLRTPGTAIVGEFFPVIFGLAKTRGEAGAETGRLELPGSVKGEYVLEVELVAEGFDVEEGQSLYNSLPVTWEKWDPKGRVQLRARPQEERLLTKTISATFIVDGQVLAMIERQISVGRSAAELGSAVPQRSPSVVEQVPPADTLDLTVIIQQVEPSAPGKLLWRYYSPHRDHVNVPGSEYRDIGQDARVFAKSLMEGVGAKEGGQGLHSLLRTRGKRIAKNMPLSFWRLLREIADYVKRPPSILLMSEEPYMPWELAVVPDPVLDPTIALPFLCAQAVTGRWLFGGPPPKAAHATDIAVSSMAVVSGVYWGPELKRLLRAEEEAACLRDIYDADPIEARYSKVLAAICGRPPAQVLHFSVHGQFDSSGQTGLLFPRPKPRRSKPKKGKAAGQAYEVLDPDEIEDKRMRGGPLVFLNACQVGSTAQILGDYTGVATAFVKAGASVVVAPLWSVRDEIAKDIALRFYEEIVRSGGAKTPAEIFREQRLRFGPRQRSGTYLAYQFFGHPGTKVKLTIDRDKVPDGCVGTA